MNKLRILTCLFFITGCTTTKENRNPSSENQDYYQTMKLEFVNQLNLPYEDTINFEFGNSKENPDLYNIIKGYYGDTDEAYGWIWDDDVSIATELFWFPENRLYFNINDRKLILHLYCGKKIIVGDINLDDKKPMIILTKIYKKREDSVTIVISEEESKCK